MASPWQVCQVCYCPNKRLKLAAPGGWGRIPFATNQARRRSLIAIR
jgi:hypothetical protein